MWTGQNVTQKYPEEQNMKEIYETVCHGRLTLGGGATSGRRFLFYDILYFLKTINLGHSFWAQGSSPLSLWVSPIT